MRGLRELGFDQCLIAPPGSRAAEEAQSLGFTVKEVPMRNSMDLGAVLGLRRAFRELTADAPSVLHLHTGRATWLGALASAGLGVPVISTRRMDRRVKRSLGTRLLYGKLLTKVVAISGPVRDCLLAGGVPDDMIETIYSSVDVDTVRHPDRKQAKADLRAELEIPSDMFVILVLARLHKRKGINVLLLALEDLANRAGLEAIRQRNLRASKSARTRKQTTIHDERIDPKSNLRVVIAGDGPERDALELQAQHLTTPSVVTFLGNRADKSALLAMCDVLVLPSLQEGLGVAALEAMASGRAVIASRVGGLAEVVEDQRTGLFAEPGNVSSLADAIEVLMNDALKCRKLGAAGPSRLAEGFLAEQMVASYAKLYAGLCTGEA